MAYIINKKARLEFSLLKQYKAGIILSGAEVKSVRLGHGSLAGSHIKIVGNEAYLLNAQINPYFYAQQTDYDAKKSRKLLLNKKELLELTQADQQKGQAIIPLSLYADGKYIKLDLAVAKGKKEYEKRAQIKARDQKREMQKEMLRY